MTDTLKELYPIIFDSITEGVFTVDSDFRITSFNAEAEKITGIDRESAIGKKCFEIFRSNICESACALRSTIASGQPFREVPINILNADMEQVPIVVSTAALHDAEGNLLGGVEIFRDVSELETLRAELDERSRYGDIIGVSEPMQRIFSLMQAVAESEAPVLITGPSGTGKELVARAIAENSSRVDKPFIAVNCGALPDNLLESELFGHLKGAFTGALQNRQGRFVAADGGTIFLDEIGDLSPAFAVKLLRVLENGEVTPLGGNKTQKVDVRLITATNRDLVAEIAAGNFREDLFYRINVVQIDLPPLAARRADIPPLIDHYLKKLSAKTGKRIQGLSDDALKALYDYDYPGNVRELVNILERAFVLCRGETIELEHLPPLIVREGNIDFQPEDKRRKPSDAAIEAARIPAAERSDLSPTARKLLEALQAHGFNRTKTAQALGIARNTLWRRMKEYGLL
jgi:PAS domain S-box-containing protein